MLPNIFALQAIVEKLKRKAISAT